MKNYNFLFMSIICLFCFSGCAVKGVYDKDLISKDINPYYSKVSNTSIKIVEDKSFFSKRPETANGGLGLLDMNSGKINNNISNEFFKQYFSNVMFEESISKKSLEVKLSVIDFKYSLGLSGNDTINIKLHGEVFNNGKLILDKYYEINENSKIIIRVWLVNGRETTIELFHKSLLEFYETEFKKDLLDAL